MSPNTSRRTRFVEEQHLATRVPQVHLPIRQSEWDHLRFLLERCKTRERSFGAAFWAAVSIAATALFSTVGFTLVEKVPEWIMRTSVAVTACAVVATVILGVVDHMFATEKVASLEDALKFMQQCQDAFVDQETMKGST